MPRSTVRAWNTLFEAGAKLGRFSLALLYFSIAFSNWLVLSGAGQQARRR
jgi:hypothetical protein